MKHGWEYKLLGEVSEIVGGSTPKTSIDSYWGGEYPWVTPAELNGAKYIDKTERTITDEALAHTNLQLLPVGTVLLSSRAPIGKLAITKTPMYCNQGFKNIIPGDSLYNEFAYWYLTYKKDYIISLGRGATFKEISKSITEKIPIPIPPIEEQTAICSLLDKLSLVIEKKKQQVKELDNLAQSIFYDMFGDPVENEKGWEVKKWADCITIYNGKNQKKVEAPNGKYPICGSGGIMGYATDFITPAHSVIVGRKGNISNPIYMPVSFWNVDTAFGLHPCNGLDSRYLYFYCRLFDFERLNKAVTIPSLTKADLLNISMAIPPLSLQQSFAQKVDSIERQKELINQSIREAQTLFDSRMEYYFGE